MTHEKKFVLIHISEIYLKSSYVKNYFQKVLLSRITDKLNGYGIRYKIYGWHHNACLVSGFFNEELLQAIANTFGVSYVTPVMLTETNFSAIRSVMQAIRAAWSDTPPVSYRITAHKDKRLSFSHYSIEYEASYFFQDWPVNLKNPALNIEIDLKTDRTAVFFERWQGAGGLPYGTQGKVISLVSNGIDSPVAAYLLAKRGCEVILLHFGDSPLHSLQKALESFTVKPIKMITLPHIPLLKTYQDRYPSKWQCIFCKLSMISIAGYFAKRLHARAIVTGDNLGQVASQTLDNLALMEKVTEIPLFRPLIGFDKQEIINLSKKLGFYQFFQNESCAFVPNEPATKMKQDLFLSWLDEIRFFDLIQDYLNQYWKKSSQPIKP